MRISVWSSDVCSSDLGLRVGGHRPCKLSRRAATAFAESRTHTREFFHLKPFCISLEHIDKCTFIACCIVRGTKHRIDSSGDRQIVEKGKGVTILCVIGGRRSSKNKNITTDKQL